MKELSEKSTTEQIRQRFDNDVERFSQLETGQQSTIDASLVMELIAQTAAKKLTSHSSVLDIGCGAGNQTLRLLQEIHPLECHLLDLSQPMLERAKERIEKQASSLYTYQNDLRNANFQAESFDCILAGAVLHHLRDENDWLGTFEKLHSWLRPGGRLYVSDLIIFDSSDVQEVMWKRYADYLISLRGNEYQESVFAYIEVEDSPRSLPFQISLIQKVGFSQFDILHRNSVFACYYAEK